MSELEITKPPPKQNGHVNGVGSRDLPTPFVAVRSVEDERKKTLTHTPYTKTSFYEKVG